MDVKVTKTKNLDEHIEVFFQIDNTTNEKKPILDLAESYEVYFQIYLSQNEQFKSKVNFSFINF